MRYDPSFLFFAFQETGGMSTLTPAHLFAIRGRGKEKIAWGGQIDATLHYVLQKFFPKS